MRAKIPLLEKVIMVFLKFGFRKKLTAIEIVEEIEKLPDWRQKK